MAFGLEQSIRILPSVSSVMKYQVGSMTLLTTVIEGMNLSEMYSQYCSEAPPSGSAPMRRPEALMASMSTTLTRSSQ